MGTLVIIGGNGFIGSYIKTYQPLIKKFKIIPVVRGSLDLLNTQEVHNFIKSIEPYAIINAFSSGGKERSKETSFDIVNENLIMFDNIRRCRHLFKKYINIGSGAEYDFSKHPEPNEDDIFTSLPKTSYGASKNIISRLCLSEENFYTLRLFGCFGVREPGFRLFSKFMTASDEFVIDDKYFDNISINNFLSILNYILSNDPHHKDINCVNAKKLLVSEQLQLLSEVTGHSRPLVIKRGIDYIGSPTRLMSLGLPLSNSLEFELEQYKCLKLSM